MFSNWRKTEGFAQTKTPNLKCNNIKAEFGLLCRPITLQFERTTMARNLLVASVISFKRMLMLSGYVTTVKSHFTKYGPPQNRSNPAIVGLLVDSSIIKLYWSVLRLGIGYADWLWLFHWEKLCLQWTPAHHASTSEGGRMPNSPLTSKQHRYPNSYQQYQEFPSGLTFNHCPD